MKFPITMATPGSPPRVSWPTARRPAHQSHWTKDLTASPDGSKLYATVGSKASRREPNRGRDQLRAAVLEVRSCQRQVARGLLPAFAIRTGLRGSAERRAGVTVMRRDETGNDLVRLHDLG